MKTFTYYIDPGHGWLKVTTADYLDLGFTASDFSTYSYVGNSGQLYLEEDCDASKFVDAYKAKHGAINIRESHCNSESHIRRMARNAA